jgi:hypothetical protein
MGHSRLSKERIAFYRCRSAPVEQLSPIRSFHGYCTGCARVHAGIAVDAFVGVNLCFVRRYSDGAVGASFLTTLAGIAQFLVYNCGHKNLPFSNLNLKTTGFYGLLN